MKASEIAELSPEEMDAREQELMEQLLNLRFQKETGEMTNMALIRSVRKDIARIKTVRNQKKKGNGSDGK
jgi:large subunit ribosomal protein L29